MSWFTNLDPESKSLKEIRAHFLQMLKDGRAAYEAARAALLEGGDLEETGKVVQAAEESLDQRTISIRRELVVHANVHGTSTFPDMLVLMSIAKDAERIGDYAMNLHSLAALRPDLGDEAEVDVLRGYADRLSALLVEGGAVFESGDEERASSYLNAIGLLEHDFQAEMVRGVQSTGSNAAGRVLALRHHKRISRHIGNIVSSLVLPLDQLDRFDEDD